VYGAVRGVAKQQATKATLFAVHSGDRRIAEGAIGESLRGLPARRDMHFRVGNITEEFTTSLLLQLVDEGRIKLSDPVSRYDRPIPYADKIQVGMLARITSGLADYVTEPDFVAANNADPFRRWTTSELLAYSARKPPVFEPGTSAQFSDTGFVLLGDILARAGRAPLAEQLQRRIFTPLKLHNTRMSLNGNVQSPVLHARSRPIAGRTRSPPSGIRHG
jgi:CubicO group peptidase (beta-lactamase class C family)